MFATPQEALSYIYSLAQRASVPLEQANLTTGLLQAAASQINGELTRLAAIDERAAKEKVATAKGGGQTPG
jgi:hypothetical protein